MFTLKKILNGRINVSEPRTITLSTALSADIAEGTPVIITAGAATAVANTSTAVATHVTMAAAKSGTKALLVLDILPGMVFETVLNSADSSAVCKAGSEVLLTAAGVTPTAISSSLRGAKVFDLPASTASGATILVTFPV